MCYEKMLVCTSPSPKMIHLPDKWSISRGWLNKRFLHRCAVNWHNKRQFYYLKWCPSLWGHVQMTLGCREMNVHPLHFFREFGNSSSHLHSTQRLARTSTSSFSASMMYWEPPVNWCSSEGHMWASHCWRDQHEWINAHFQWCLVLWRSVLLIDVSHFTPLTIARMADVSPLLSTVQESVQWEWWGGAMVLSSHPFSCMNKTQLFIVVLNPIFLIASNN